jgi:hypothetical protein
LRKDRRLIFIVTLRPGWNLTHAADHSTLHVFETLRRDSFKQLYEDLSNLSVFRDRCEDVTPRLCIELALIDRHENVAIVFRARARAIAGRTQAVHLRLGSEVRDRSRLTRPA